MHKIQQRPFTGRRNSSIELLKIFAILLIVISHVVQTLHTPNEFVPSDDYVMNLSMATTSVQQFILTLLRYNGALGNTIFFVCSAWFLLDSDGVSKKKILQIAMDVWVISATIMIVVCLLRGGNLGLKTMIIQLFPVTFETNWYVTCYLMFYPLHPFLNWVIRKMAQKTLLRTTLVLLFLYVCVNYIISGHFFPSNIILWISIYFAIAYMKHYLVDLSNNVKANLLLLGLGFAGNTGIVLLTNILGLRIGAFSGWLLKWSVNCSPFLILMAVSMLNIAKNVYFQNKVVNYISGLSLLIYLFHENQLLRNYYRPLLWDYVYNRFGYDYVLVWALVLAAIVFLFGLAASVLYKATLQKAVSVACNWLYPVLQKTYGKMETLLLKLH